MGYTIIGVPLFGEIIIGAPSSRDEFARALIESDHAGRSN